MPIDLAFPVQDILLLVPSFLNDIGGRIYVAFGNYSTIFGVSVCVILRYFGDREFTRREHSVRQRA